MATMHYASNTNVLKPDIRTGLFKFCFFAVKRSDPQAKAERKEVYATDLKSAKSRLLLVFVIPVIKHNHEQVVTSLISNPLHKLLCVRL